MKRLLMLVLLGVMGLFALSVQAVVETYEFDTAEQKALYQKMARELRCVVCQNQTILESNAPLAQDLRQQLYQMIRYQQADEKQIIAFMVQRYGDFVLYRPPFQANTLILWIMPFLMLLFSVYWVVSYVRQTQKIAQQQQESKQDD
ncbi:cytochrome c-type biogenesis protein CcmH [Thiomicrospira microaerophila]|uniref:cytochrome c-type biogenesis protein n=1 Tax=Thiomicrospira microaerophila TaxID=406020 RepID=UPI00200EDA65|nr:cytochrome c-type biogenesis protein [Thiomicrospira microaerophila]UQB42347.1 cytochrome c-type biogenesis protein CcmH [Thiomicrospira microaerophila]